MNGQINPFNSKAIKSDQWKKLIEKRKIVAILSRFELTIIGSLTGWSISPNKISACLEKHLAQLSDWKAVSARESSFSRASFSDWIRHSVQLIDRVYHWREY